MEEAEKNPWKTNKSEWIYDTPWIGVQRHEVTNPAGNPGIYSTIHFKNKAIGVIPLDENNNTWIVGQFRYPLGKYSWEIPEGGGNPKIPYVESAARELLEETGIIAQHYELLLSMDLSNSVSDEEALVYVARGLSFTDAEPEETEILQVKKVSFDELFRMVMAGEIRDAITVAAVMKLKLLL